MSEKQTIKIENVGYSGVGFAKLKDGKVCMVPYTLPGEIC